MPNLGHTRTTNPGHITVLYPTHSDHFSTKNPGQNSTTDPGYITVGLL